MKKEELIKALQGLPAGAVITAETADGGEFVLLGMVFDEECDLSMIMLREI